MKAPHAQSQQQQHGQESLAQTRGRALCMDDAIKESENNPRIAPPLKITDCSQITDGAAAVLLMSEDRAKALGYTPIAYIKSYAYAALDPGEWAAPLQDTIREARDRALERIDGPVVLVAHAYEGAVISASADPRSGPVREELRPRRAPPRRARRHRRGPLRTRPARSHLPPVGRRRPARTAAG